MKSLKCIVLFLLVFFSYFVVANPFVDALEKTAPKIKDATAKNGWASEGKKILTHMRLRTFDKVPTHNGMTTLAFERQNGNERGLGEVVAWAYYRKLCADPNIKEAVNKLGYNITIKIVADDSDDILSTILLDNC